MSSQPPASPKRVSLKTYRDAFPGRWTIYWLMIPNLTIILMWFVGGPPMSPALALFGLAALALAQLPWTWVKRLALAIMIAEVSYYYVCALFNLDRSNVAMLPAFVGEVRPLHSPEYLVAAAMFLAATVVALVRAPRVPRFRSPMSYILGFIMVFAFIGTDLAATSSTRGSYHATPPEGAYFTAASTLSGVTTPSATRHNLVFIVVESLGLPVEPAARGLFERDWNRAHWRARYDVERGTIPYYGATTNGEVRELCGKWGNYNDFDFLHGNCLPARYARGGYETTGIHGFAGWFFDRERWYPQLGFQHRLFEDELLASGAEKCPGVFPGVCDRSIPPIIHSRLKQARKPQLIYWMTLSTHLPVVDDPGLQTDHCALGPPGWAQTNAQACRLFLLHHQLADAIDAIAMDPNLPPTDFVIVGDHMPPFLDREARLMFDNAHVPWVFLRARDPKSLPQVAAR